MASNTEDSLQRLCEKQGLKIQELNRTIDEMVESSKLLRIALRAQEQTIGDLRLKLEGK